ncbi:hypothetical protein JW711_06115 [Candidatus Woesearchaeota archaeon]|nr:hypothetical protein [Candidatus Woesearchaeota archaeon]
MEGQYEELNRVIRELNTHKQRFRNVHSLAGLIDATLADDFLQKARQTKKEIAGLQENWQITDGDKRKDTQVSYCFLPYLALDADSFEAVITITKEKPIPFTARQLFELHLRREGMAAHELEDVVDAYHSAVEQFFSLQNKCVDLGDPGMNVSEVPEFERASQRVLYELDQIASAVFGRRLHTPANIDTKESSPHQSLGRINVGYTHTMPELVRILGHEGPFGHNTHTRMSEDSNYTLAVSHDTEGLAVLGEQIALKLYYRQENGSGPLAPLIELMKAKRDLNDALHAAYQKLAFYDGVSQNEIVRQLTSRYVQELPLRAHTKDLEQNRDAMFQFGTIPYYIGAKIVRRTYESAKEALEALKATPEENQEHKYALLRTMFSGRRPACIIARDVDLFLQDLKARQ